MTKHPPQSTAHRDPAPGGAGRLVALVVSYNRLDKLRETLARLLASPVSELSGVVVVENASTDGTQAWLETLNDPRLHLLCQTQNLGGAGGFKLGLRWVHDRLAPDWIVVMDDDARPMPGAFAQFHQMDLTHWDAVAAAVYYPDGRICTMNTPSLNPFFHAQTFWQTLGKGRAGFHLTQADYAGAPRQVDVSSFVGLFVSRGAIMRNGFPDGRLFVYAEDGLYTLGLTRAGEKIGFLPAVQFEHDCSTFAAHDSKRFQPLWKIYYYHRNLLMLYRDAAGPWFWPALLLILPKWAAKLAHHSGERRAAWRLLSLAVLHGIARRTEIRHSEVIARAEGK